MFKSIWTSLVILLSIANWSWAAEVPYEFIDAGVATCVPDPGKPLTIDLLEDATIDALAVQLQIKHGLPKNQEVVIAMDGAELPRDAMILASLCGKDAPAGALFLKCGKTLQVTCKPAI